MTIGSGPHDESFTIPLGAGGGIALMAPALGRKLADVAVRGEGHIVILSPLSRECHYTQCLTDPDDGAWVEAVSNTFIEPAHLRLDTGQETTLAGLGFRPPGTFSPNHHRTFDQPVPWARVAELLILPLVLVYGVANDDLIQVTIGPEIMQPPTLPVASNRCPGMIPVHRRLPTSGCGR